MQPIQEESEQAGLLEHGSETSMGIVARDVQEVLASLGTKRAADHIESLLERAGHHFTKGSVARLLERSGARLERYRVQPIVIKKGRDAKSVYTLQASLYRAWQRGDFPVRVSAPGLAGDYLVELDYRALRGRPLHEELLPLLRDEVGPLMALSEARVAITEEAVAQLHHHGAPPPGPPTSREVHRYLGKLKQSAYETGHRIPEGIEEALDVAWESYYDPSDLNLLFLSPAGGPDSTISALRNGDPAPFRRLIKTDYERCFERRPRMIHRLHDVATPGMTREMIDAVVDEPHLDTSLRAYALRELSHVVEGRKGGGSLAINYFEGLLRS